MPGTTEALEVLQDIVDLLTDPVSGCALTPEPCRIGVVPGIDVAWDSCGQSPCGPESGRDGQLWANLTGHTARPDQQTPGCSVLDFTAEIGLVRCAATVGNDGQSPSAERVAADAWQQALDADAIWSAVTCCPERSETVRGIVPVSWRPIGPQGGCVGGIWTVRGVLDVCC